MKKRYCFPVFLILILALCFSCVLPACAADPVPVENITLSQETAVVSVGKTITLQASILPKNATAKKPEWISSDESVATVQNGKVKGIAPGTATITAKAADESGVSASAVVTVVIPVSKITAEETKIVLAPDTTWDLVTYIEPEDASIQDLAWESGNLKVATVNENGTITAIAPGKCTITGKAMDDSRKKIALTVVVKEHEVMILTPGDFTVDFDMKEGSGWTVRTENGKVKKVDDHTLRPVAAGSDVLSIIETKSKKVTRILNHTVFVSQAAVRQIGAVPEESEKGQALFRGIPWNSTYTEVESIIESRGETLKPLTLRNEVLWTQIDGELQFGSFTAFNNGLSFRCDKIDESDFARNNNRCYLSSADYYFDSDIPFENLKQNVMKAYDLPKNETTGSASECIWTVGDVKIELTLKTRFTLLTLTCEAE